jgi:hypothetical protein
MQSLCRPYAKLPADLMSRQAPGNGTGDAWGAVGHGQKSVLVHGESKPTCASQGTMISLKSAQIVHGQSRRDTMVFLEMRVCFLPIIVDHRPGLQTRMWSSVGAGKGDGGVACMRGRQMR